MASFGVLPTEIAQNCVEFLAFDEAIEVKSVSRGLHNRATCSETWALIHVHLRCSVDIGLRVRLQDYLWGINLSLVFPGLESWADAKLAATLLDEFRSLVTVQTPDPRRRLLVGVARMWSLNWQDRDKAELFVAEAERIQHVFRSAGPGATWDY